MQVGAQTDFRLKEIAVYRDVLCCQTGNQEASKKLARWSSGESRRIKHK